VPAALARRAPPGPAGFPFAGVFPMARRDPLRFFAACARRYGDVVAMRLGSHRVYLLRHPDHVGHVLQDRARIYAKGPAAGRVDGLFGDSLTVVDGDRWLRRRRQMLNAFQPGLHARFETVVSGAVAELLAGWRIYARNGEPVELAGEMRRLSQTIIIRFCFGEVPADELRRLCQALDSAVDHVERRLWSPLAWLDARARAGPGHRALGAVDAFIARMVSGPRGSLPTPGTLLAALLDAPAGERLTPIEIRRELKAVLVAGHTTTASALAWIWYVLSQHPDALERVEQECQTALNGRPAAAADLPRLGYTRRVIDEVLRLYPPTWLTARSPGEDDALGGYVVPVGSLVFLSPYLTHRHPAVWEDPERFDPERFTPARAALRPAFAYFPFGGGPRRCIGSGLAAAEAQMIVATVVQRYRLALLPGQPIVPAAGLTLRPGPAMPSRIAAH